MVTLTPEMRQYERRMVEEFFQVKVPEILDPKISNSSCTESSCIFFAQDLLRATDITAVDNQGSNSFTLVSPSLATIVQFRLKPLDTTAVTLAHKIYGNLVPEVVPVSNFPLPVYTSKALPGRVHFHQPFPTDQFPLQRELATVTDLGRFVARAAWFESPRHYEALSFTASATDMVDRLLKNGSLKSLAPELVNIIAEIQSQLHLLQKLPAVLTHNDFSQINILVDDEGRVTGVVDFESARTEAFGTCIWGLYECFFGSMEKGEWSFYNMAAESDDIVESVFEVLAAAFWDALWANTPPSLKRGEETEKAVKVATSVGVIGRYFIHGMLDKIDLDMKVHQLSLEYARGILPRVWR